MPMQLSVLSSYTATLL